MKGPNQLPGTGGFGGPGYTPSAPNQGFARPPMGAPMPTPPHPSGGAFQLPGTGKMGGPGSTGPRPVDPAWNLRPGMGPMNGQMRPPSVQYGYGGPAIPGFRAGMGAPRNQYRAFVDTMLQRLRGRQGF